VSPDLEGDLHNDGGYVETSWKLLILSEENADLLTAAFSSSLPSLEGRKIRNSFPTPEVAVRKYPSLDPLFKSSSSLKLEAITGDTELSRIQALVLD
jgi:hypothetical protein